MPVSEVTVHVFTFLHRDAGFGPCFRVGSSHNARRRHSESGIGDSLNGYPFLNTAPLCHFTASE